MTAAAQSSGRKLTLADQALANALIFLAAQMTQDERTDMVLRELPDLLPAASRDIRWMAALAAAGAEVMTAAPRRGQKQHAPAWAAAQLTLRAAVADFAFWRGGLALDALRATLPPKEGDAA